MTSKIPSGAIKHRESTEPEKSSNSQNPFSPFIRWATSNCVNLSQRCSHKAAAFYTEQCMISSEVLQGVCSHPLNNYTRSMQGMFGANVSELYLLIKSLFNIGRAVDLCVITKKNTQRTQEL